MKRSVTVLGFMAAMVGVLVFVMTLNAPQVSANEKSKKSTGACAAGDVRHDFAVDWNSDQRSGTIRTIDGRKLCNDVEILFSSYTLPVEYNGGAWWDAANNRVNQTMVPQQNFATKRYTLKGGTDGSTKLTVETNPACGRWVQVDAIVGSEEIKTIVGRGGAEDRIVQGKVSKNADCEEKKEEPKTCPDGSKADKDGKCPEKPAPAVKSDTAPTPPPAAPVATTLPNTGPGAVFVLSGTAAALTTGISLARRKGLFSRYNAE